MCRNLSCGHILSLDRTDADCSTSQSEASAASCVFRRTVSGVEKQSSGRRVEWTSCTWPTTTILSTIVTIATVQRSRPRPARRPALIVRRFIQLNPLSDRLAPTLLPCQNHLPTPGRPAVVIKLVDDTGAAFSSRRATSPAYQRSTSTTSRLLTPIKNIKPELKPTFPHST